MSLHNQFQCAEGFSDYTVVGSRLLKPREAGLARLGDAYGTTSVIATTAGVVAGAATAAAGMTVAATAATAATLFGSAAAASAVPVIGWIAAAIAVIAGILVKVFGKRKARKAETRAINAQVTELKQIASELDTERSAIQRDMIAIQNQMIRLGYTDVVQTYPVPNSSLGSAKSDLADAKKNFDNWNNIVEVKVKALEKDKSVLQNWYDALTGAKRKEGILIGAGVLALIATTLLLLPKSKN